MEVGGGEQRKRRVLGQLLEEHHVLEPPRMGSLL